MFGTCWVLAQWVDPSNPKGSCTTLQDVIPALKTLHPTSPRKHIQLVMFLYTYGANIHTHGPMAWTSRLLAPHHTEVQDPWSGVECDEVRRAQLLRRVLLECSSLTICSLLATSKPERVETPPEGWHFLAHTVAQASA